MEYTDGERRIAAFAKLVIRGRYAVIVLAVLAGAGLAFGAQLLRFATDYQIYFSEENPQLIAYDELQNTYSKTENIIFVVSAADGGGIFTTETLAAIEWLTERAWKTPYSRRVDSLSNFPYLRAEDDELIVGDLVRDALSLDPEALTSVQSVALNDPQILGRIISKDALVSAVYVTLEMPGDNPATETKEIIDYAESVVADAASEFPEVTLRLTGVAPMNMTFQEATIRDMTTLVPIMFVTMLALLALLLGSVVASLLTVFIIVLSVFGAMGGAGWLGVVLSNPSANAPLIIMTVAIADCAHFFSVFFYALREKKLPRIEAIVYSLQLNFVPMFLTSLTTALGFLVLNFGEVPPFADLGNIVAGGVAIAFVLSITLLPALAAIIPMRSKARSGMGSRFLYWLGAWVVRSHRTVLWSVSLIAVLFLAMLPLNRINDVFLEFFDESFEFRRSSDFFTEHLTGLYDIHYSLSAGAPDAISDPEFLRRVDAFSQWFLEQPNVKHVNSVLPTIKRLNQALHDDDPNFYRLPSDPGLAAQYLLLYEMSLPYGLDLNDQINVDKSALRLSVAIETVSSNELLALEERAQQWLAHNGLPSMRTPGASGAIMFANIGYRNSRAMLTATVTALVCISLMLIIAFRSVRYGLLSLIPNLLPAGIAFGVWGVFDGQISLALSVVAGITLGIVVDDTVHFMSKYLHALRARGATPADSVSYAFTSVGSAMMASTFALALGFAILAWSNFKLNSELGVMVALTTIIAMLIDMTLLPALLLRMGKKGTS